MAPPRKQAANGEDEHRPVAAGDSCLLEARCIEHAIPKLDRHVALKVASVCIAVGLVMGGVPLLSDVLAQTVERQLYVSVLDGDGVPIQGLAEGDFVVQEDGVGQDVLRVGPATEPMQVDTLVDSSAGTRLLIKDFRDALQGFARELPTSTQMALITFGGVRTVVVEATDDHER